MPIHAYTVEIDGQQYDLEGDHEPSEAEARAAVGATAPAVPKRATPPPASATIGMLQPSTATSRAPTGTLMDLIPPPDQIRQDMGRYKESLGLAIPTPPVQAMASGAKAVPGILARAAGVSKARAGENIAEAVTAAKDVPLTTPAIQAAVDEMMQYSGIENVPRVVRSLAKRLTTGPLTVEKARLYAPAVSRGSANEFANLSPNMQRLLGGLRAPLNEAITDAAATVGKGEQYASGMKEYARANKARKFATETLSPAAVSALKWLLKGTALGGTFEAGRRLFD